MFPNPTTLPDLVSHEEATRAVCEGVDPESVPVSDAVAAFECLARMERLVVGAKVRMARRVEAARAAQVGDARDAAEFLARAEGSSIGAARDSLATSKRLLDQPLVEEATRRGELSTSQVAVISDAAAVNPAAALRLVDAARQTSVGELRRACAQAKAAADPDPGATHRRIHARRHLRRGVDAEGAWGVYGRGTVDAGAEIDAALDPIVDELFNAARGAGRPEPREAYAFDALVELARRQAGGPRSDVKPRRRARRHLVLVRVDLDALVRGSVHGEERCEITGLGPIPVRVAREVLGDSILRLVITRGVDVANVTHLGRGASAAQRIALLWSQPHCTVLGCPRIHSIEHDHRVPWAAGRQTRLDNLDPLCGHHHELKTRRGWALAAGTGRRPMVTPDDPRHPAHAPPEPVSSVPTPGRQPNVFGHHPP